MTGQMDYFEGRLAYARYLRQAHPEGLEAYLALFAPDERKRLEDGLAEDGETAAAFSLSERLREAAVRWSPGVDFGPDLLREAADKIDALSYARSYLSEPDEAAQEDVAFLAAMLDLAPKGHATASEYGRLERLAEPYLAGRFESSDVDLPDDDSGHLESA